MKHERNTLFAAAIALSIVFQAASCRTAPTPAEKPVTSAKTAKEKPAPEIKSQPEKFPEISLLENPQQEDPVSFTFDMDKAVEEFYRDFPGTKKRISFNFDGDLAHAEPSTVHVPLKIYTAQYTMIDYFKNWTESRDDMHLPDTAIYRNDDFCRQFVFDHECGHALHFNYFKKTVNTTHNGECFGDCYAMIRHIQRFGRNDGFPEAWTLQRARLVGVFDGWYGNSHMTTACLLHILSLDPDKLACLSVEETIRLAADAALNHDLTDREYDVLQARAFFLRKGDVANRISGFSSLAFEEETRGDTRMRPLILAYLQSVKLFYKLDDSTMRKLDTAIDSLKTGDQNKLGALPAATADKAGIFRAIIGPVPMRPA